MAEPAALSSPYYVVVFLKSISGIDSPRLLLILLNSLIPPINSDLFTSNSDTFFVALNSPTTYDLSSFLACLSGTSVG